MRHRSWLTLKRRFALIAGTIVLVVLSTRAYAAFRAFVASGSGAHATGTLMAPDESGSDTTADSAAAPMALPDSLRGHSGAVLFATLTPSAAEGLSGFLSHFGESALRIPAAHFVPAGADSFALVTLRAFGSKHGEYVNGYRVGLWPAERWIMARNYFNPDGFIEVTPETATLRLSRHFVLGEFVTHDQESVWPKYVVLEPKLIDKLELILEDLAAHGHPSDHPVILSGFRAPYYNERGEGEGMARASRHQYGDAADLVIDEDGDGRMDDLNGDGKSNLGDVRPITSGIARLEARFPDLVGGLGTYAAMGPRGPFVHVDVRGTDARWEGPWLPHRNR